AKFARRPTAPGKRCAPNSPTPHPNSQDPVAMSFLSPTHMGSPSLSYGRDALACSESKLYATRRIAFKITSRLLDFITPSAPSSRVLIAHHAKSTRVQGADGVMKSMIPSS